MLNLRLAHPDVLVQIGHLDELRGVAETADAVTIGACVTHAAFADGLVPDVGPGVLARVAEGIAYRAVRNRGTIGGSLCHADPAADWVTALMALGAEVLLRSGNGAQRMGVAAFVTGAFSCALERGELLAAVQVPKLPDGAGFGFVKACRKPGEFAHAMAAALVAGDTTRVVIGALRGRPRILEGPVASVEGARQALSDLDEVARRMQLAVVRRALDEAGA
jgi:carbon-monoxide dehydrogenase medium subunit